MRRHLAPLAASAALAIFVAACSSSATPSPTAPPAAAASVAPSVAPSAAPSMQASAAPAASTAPAASGALPSLTLPNEDTNLEALLPSTFGGAKLQKLSMKGADFLGQSSNADLANALGSLGLTAADVSVAIASDIAETSGLTFIAIRFAGADSSKLLQVFQAASQASGQTVTSVNLGGKAALKATDSSGSSSYFYVKNDTILGVTAPDDATAATMLAVLP